MTLEFKQVGKRAGAAIHIYPTDLTLEDGGFNILLGTTLSGKTTMLHLMAGLDRPTSGEVWFNGKNVTGAAVQARNVSMVHQQFINYPNFNVFENIASPLRIQRTPAAEIDRRVAGVAELLNLTPLLGRGPHELSGGQQQRTALARALVKDADLVLLDEPLANLDFKLREELRDELPKLFENRGCTVVYATSEPNEALLLGGHTATLHEGRVTQFGKTQDIYRRPKDLRSAQVFADPPMNTAPVAKRGETFVLSEAVRWPATERQQGLGDSAYTVGIRPHHITPVAGSGDAVPIVGKVLITEFSGSESIIHFQIEGQVWVSQSQGIHPFEIGSRGEFFLDATKCIYFGPDNELVSA